jgi:putative sterol carrier protein
MPRFLTEEWMDAVIAELSEGARSSLRDITFTLQQRISGAPQGDVAIWTSFDDDAVAGGVGEAPHPDVTFEMAYDTAMALARGELNHQAAFMQGKLTVTGNMGKLLLSQGALQALGPAMSTIDTEY